MAPRDAANLVSRFDKEKLEMVLRKMPMASAESIQQVISYKEGTAARYMREDFVEVHPEQSVEEAIQQIRAMPQRPDSLYYVYVAGADGVLSGVVSLKHLVLTAPDRSLGDVMVTSMVTADISDPIEYVGEVMTKYDLMSLPVVDIQGKIRGVIDVEDILDVVIERAKAHQPVELSDGQKEELRKEKSLKGYAFHFIRDVGQFVTHLELLRLKKKDERRKDV
jgi:Mg/Co/Ni transporter MgtE